MGKLQEVIKKIQPVDTSRTNAIQAQLDNLTKPQGSLGRLEELAKKYCLITGKDKPRIGNKIIFTFAGDHGVTDEGVSAFPKEVTPQMVYQFYSRRRRGERARETRGRAGDRRGHGC